MDKTKPPVVAANHFTPEEKHLLAERSVGLCSGSQALSPTVTERLHHGQGVSLVLSASQRLLFRRGEPLPELRLRVVRVRGAARRVAVS